MLIVGKTVAEKMAAKIVPRRVDICESLRLQIAEGSVMCGEEYAVETGYKCH